ncbi:MAG: histidine kinase [Nitrosomonadales bacterium]|nr:histidine kinase [Nitrosomonadales bacterium]
MHKTRSIKQNDRPDALPNFRNLGVTLRILLISNCLALLQAILMASAWSDIPHRMMEIVTLLTPILLASLLLLSTAQPWLNRFTYRRGALAVAALVLMLTLFVNYIGSEYFHPMGGENSNFDAFRYGLISMIESGILLLYFRLRSRTLSRALHDARLQVLRARIRPHFLFNSINAVLGIVRTQPKQAEAALEDMADLFRMAMTEGDDLVPLRQEIQLCKQYIALEQLRIGDRLRTDWQVQDMPDDALIPPLLLQPLLENAVYHGIEPLPSGGCVEIMLRCKGDELHLKVKNPCTLRRDEQHPGNRIALRNIRERLDLLFDVEANYKAERGKDYYCVEIVMPCVKEKST